MFVSLISNPIEYRPLSKRAVIAALASVRRQHEPDNDDELMDEKVLGFLWDVCEALQLDPLEAAEVIGASQMRQQFCDDFIPRLSGMGAELDWINQHQGLEIGRWKPSPS